ncbi:hypothetical protein BDV18DRAFT_166675 [Aspergillus unguis]
MILKAIPPLEPRQNPFTVGEFNLDHGTQKQQEPVCVDSQETVPGRELLDALASLRLEPKYSDLTISCGNDTDSVHQCIVCTRSAFFAGACDGGFVEASTRVITLNEDPALVKQMVEYIYTLDYQADPNVPIPDDRSIESFELTPLKPSVGYDTLSFHILMYSLADRLFIAGLKALSAQYVEQELVRRLDARSYPDAVSEIYRSTPTHDRGLRDLAVKITMDHLTTLRQSDGIASATLQNSLLESLPQFAHDLRVAMMDECVYGVV